MLRPFLVLIPMVVSACSSQAKPLEVEPVNCIAAFVYAANLVQGTHLQSDPQAAELRVRILYEQERAAKHEEISRVESQVLDIGKRLDQDSAIKVAKGCMIEQEMGDDYRRQRPRLIQALRVARDKQGASLR